MKPDRSLRTLFTQALDCADAVERARYLDEACGTDSAVRERIEALLRAHDKAGGFFSQPAKTPPSGEVSATVALPVTEKAGDTIGRYKLLQQIGEGGCGVVYMAEQEEPVRRRVALKVIKLGMDTRQVVARFEAERQALAMMDHPNIARVLDAGATETGRPYFVMELVRGTKITEFCDEKTLSPRERLELLFPVCQAVQHAHQKGIIHRDLKPSNILVTTVDGKPVPKVIDFGIAKATSNQRLTDMTLFTAFEQFIGTPAYMSPEQAEMSGVDIDTRTDIYSLGVVLYELLTGKTPFDSEQLLRSGIDEIRRTIREQEPVKPSTRLNALSQADLTTTAQARQTDAPKLIHNVRGDLDWVVMKCLEKERDRRYETANGLAHDIERHLKNEPVTARPPSNLYRFQKLVRRNKLAFAATSAVTAALLIGVVASTWQAVRATRAEREQSRLRKEAQANAKAAQTEAAKSRQVAQFMQDMLKGVGPSVALGRDTTMLREILDQTAERVGKELTNQPPVEAELRASIGEVYLALGEYAKAEAFHRDALALRKQIHGSEHVDVAQSLNWLAIALWKGGRLREAEKLLRECLAMRRKLLGDEHPQLARCLYDLAEVLRYRNKSGAEATHREALAMRRKLLGNEHLEVADSLNRLGSLLSTTGRDEDEILLREALEIRRKLLGSEHPDIAESLDNLAHSLTRQKEFREAEPMHREALAMRRKYFPREHAEVAGSLANMGTVLKRQGKLAEAEAMLREGWEMRHTLRGYDNGVRLFNSLAGLLRSQGRLDDEEALCRERLAWVKSQFGEVSREVDNTLVDLGSLLKRQGKLAEAEAVYREEIELEKKLSEEGHPNVVNSLGFLASTLNAQGKFAEAETLFREVLARRRKDNHEAAIAVTLNNLANVLSDTGRSAEAEGMYRESLSITKNLFGEEHRETAVCLNNLGLLLMNLDRFSEADAMIRQALAIHRKIQGQDSLGVATAFHNLGRVFKARGNFTEAEAMFREALAMRRKLLGNNDLQLSDTLGALGVVLSKQGKLVEAENTMRESLRIRETERPNVWKTFYDRSILGDILFEQKRYAEAETLLVSGLDGMLTRLDNMPASIRSNGPRDALERLTKLYEATGRPAEAARAKSKLLELNETAAH